LRGSAANTSTRRGGARTTERVARERDELAAGAAHARAELDRRDRDLAVHAGRKRKRRGRLDRRMALEDALDLDRVDVDAVHDHHVVGAAVDDELPVDVERREIAGLEPAVAEVLAVATSSPT
jgi:hypothetical protein